jgi:hypothetical protein
MDIQKIATYGTAVAVVGTGSVVGGGALIDQQTGGPQKRAQAEETELRMIIREELKQVLWEAWPEKTGPVKTYPKPDPNGDYRETTPK